MSMALWTNAHVIAIAPRSGKIPRMNRFRAEVNRLRRK
jgi:hypothetical protein